jgi:hypothetical protein
VTSSWRAFGVLGLLAVLVSHAAAQTGGYTRFAGGGPRATDCMLVTDVAGATGRRSAACTDGDPACDGDGLADGTCTFRVRVCLDAVSPGTARCHADVVTEAHVTSGAPALDAALQAVGMPVATPDTCTDPVAVAGPTRGRRPGRTIVRAQAAMASGHADRDRVVLVCRPRPAAATFATIQRKVFTPACTAPSCHGGGGAGGLVLSAGAAYGDLVGVAASNPAAHAAGLLRVAPGDPDRSFLLRKLAGTLGAGEGAPMPFGGSHLPAGSIDLVRRWIAAGAPADAGF